MRAKTQLVSFVLCAVLIFGFALTASAQVSFQVGSTPTDVIQTGVAEVLGEVALTKVSTPPGTPQTTIASTINILYQGVVISNTFTGSISMNTVTAQIAASNGITISSGAAFNNAAVSATVSNTPGGGQLTISIPAGLTVADGERLTIDGVRGNIAGVMAPATVQANLSANPSNAFSFVNVSQITVARPNTGLVLAITGVTHPICIRPPAAPFASIRITEGFPGAFVQHITVMGAVPSPRRYPTSLTTTEFGATANTQIRILVTNLPSGVTLSWPATVNETTTPVNSTLRRLSQAGTGNTDVVYEYTTLNQGLSDIRQEVFTITPGVALIATAGFGQSTAQAQLNPPGTTTLMPRFNDPLRPDPGANFINVTRCVTNLLFPFVTNVPGWDTGLAIANTSFDQGAIAPTTAPQSGPVTLYFYKTFAPGGTAAAPTTFTVPNVEAGNTWANTLASMTGFAGGQGYVIAVCQFQYGHGFAFIVQAVGGVFTVAEGYLATVIPDVSVTGALRLPNPPAAGAGESLAH